MFLQNAHNDVFLVRKALYVITKIKQRYCFLEQIGYNDFVFYYSLFCKEIKSMYKSLIRPKYFIINFLCACIIACCYTQEQNVWSHPQPAWHYKIDQNALEYALRTEEIIDSMSMSEYLTGQGKGCEFTHEVKIVVLKSGIKAVFKDGVGRFAEVAAYRASRALNINMVPPTVLRTVGGQDGSLQFYVASPFDLTDTMICKSAYDQIDQHDILRMKLFYFVFGQWDIGPANQIIALHNNQAYLALIDNAGMHNKVQVRYGDYEFIRRGYSNTRQDDWTAPFPFDAKITLLNPGIHKLAQIFGEYLDNESLDNIWHRVPIITYALWQNALWIQYYAKHPYISPNYVAQCPRILVEPYYNLDREFLRLCWAEALATNNKKHYEELIELALQRCEEMLKKTITY